MNCKCVMDCRPDETGYAAYPCPEKVARMNKVRKQYPRWNAGIDTYTN